MATFPERLKKIRKANDLTIKELADEIGTTKSTISRYENNKREPKTYLLKKLANYFDVSVDYLLGNTDEKSNADKIKKAISDDPELVEFWDKAKDREDLQLMLKQTKDLKPSTIKQIIEIIKTFEKEQDDKYNGK
ncbi:MAG: helix-turn-helix domain-containing protein [Halanaerobiales bacterium]|nr:helix-turn-helix domain-containing protein [Halanaerobiales bacterium]